MRYSPGPFRTPPWRGHATKRLRALTGAAAAPGTANVGHAAATGQAFGITVNVAVTTGHAAATGVANGVTGNVSNPVGHAAAVGVANPITVNVQTPVGHAAATGQAFDVVGSVGGVTANVGHAAATGAAFGVTATHITTAQVQAAAAAGAAFGVTVNVRTPVGHAAGSGAAFGVTATHTRSANVGHAAGTGTAFNPRGNIVVTVGHASATGVAFNILIDELLPDLIEILKPAYGFWLFAPAMLGVGWQIEEPNMDFWKVSSDMDDNRFPSTSTRYLRCRVYARKDGADFSPVALTTRQALVNENRGDTEPITSDWVTGAWETDGGVYYSRTLFNFNSYGNGAFDWYVEVQATPETVIEKVGRIILT